MLAAMCSKPCAVRCRVRRGRVLSAVCRMEGFHSGTACNENALQPGSFAGNGVFGGGKGWTWGTRWHA